MLGLLQHFDLTLLLPLLDERERYFISFPIIGSSNSDLVLFSTWGNVPVVIQITLNARKKFELLATVYLHVDQVKIACIN